MVSIRDFALTAELENSNYQLREHARLLTRMRKSLKIATGGTVRFLPTSGGVVAHCTLCTATSPGPNMHSAMSAIAHTYLCPHAVLADCAPGTEGAE
jgi:hypothetical protein